MQSVDTVKKIHEKIWESVIDFWTPNKSLGHGVDHAKRIYKHAIDIAGLEGANMLVVGAACYLTDVGLNSTTGRENHIERSLEIASFLLPQFPELESKKELIFEAIKYHEAEHEAPANISIETKVVRDSETLDRLGLTGIKMTLTYGLSISRPLYNIIDPLCLNKEPQIDDFSMDYVRYLFAFEDKLLTKTAKQAGRVKLAEMSEYCSAFEDICKKNQTLDYSKAFILLESLGE